MAFSDGHPHPPANPNNPTTFIAMETSPIKNLSTTSSPGLKLVLHGSIVVRLGILQLNDGNCNVIGGEIEGWKEVWRKAKEKAAREKGLGVDPTIKALIWNPLTGGEEDEDEGEGASGDVTASPSATVPLSLVPEPAIPTNQSTTHRQNSNNSHATSQNNRSYQNQTSRTSNATTNNASSRGSSAAATAAAGINNTNLRQRTLDSFPKKPRPETTRLLPGNSASTQPHKQQTLTPSSSAMYARSNAGAIQKQNASTNPYQQRAGKNNSDAGNNPYQRPNNINGTRNVQQPKKHRGPPAQQQQHHQRQLPASMQLNNTSIIPIDDSPPASAHKQPSMTLPKKPQQQRIHSNPYASLRPANSTPTATSTVSSTTSFAANPSFAELKSILQSLRTQNNRALYEQYYNKIITVPCKLDSEDNDKVFNIVKANSSPESSGQKKGKKDKKYEFLFVGKFWGPKASEGVVACRVESSILEPYFDGHSPVEIRKLSRVDKERANRIVNQSCSAFLHDCSSLGNIQMKLLLNPDDFFEKAKSMNDADWLADTSNPYLLVVKRAT